MPHYNATLPAQTAAGADAITVVGDVEASVGGKTTTVTASLVPPPGFAPVTGQATNNVTFSVRQLRGGAVVATVASVTLTAGTNLTAETPLAVTVPTYALSSFAAGDVIDVLMHQNGTGLAIGAGIAAQVNLE